MPEPAGWKKAHPVCSHTPFAYYPLERRDFFTNKANRPNSIIRSMLRIELASPPISGSIDVAIPWVERFITEAADGEADIVCFPECYIPGLRGQDFAVEAHNPVRLAAARERVRDLAASHRIAVVMSMESRNDRPGRSRRPGVSVRRRCSVRSIRARSAPSRPRIGGLRFRTCPGNQDCRTRRPDRRTRSASRLAPAFPTRDRSH